MIVQVAGRTISKYSVALLVIVLAGLFLRVYHLGAESLWGDEIFSFFHARPDVGYILRLTVTEDIAPPLYYYLLHFWMKLFGTSEFALRFLSLAFGVLAIPVIYLLGRRLFNEEVGLISALFLAISPFNVEYSQELRMYSLLLFLALLSMYFFVHFLERGSLAISVGYVLSTALLLYTHLFGLFVLIAQNIFVAGLLLLSRQHRSQLKQWILIQATIVIIFAPWISVLPRQVTWAAQTTYIVGTSYTNPITLVLNLATGRWGTYYPSVALLILFLGLAVFSLFTYRRAAQHAFKGYAWEDRKNLATVCLLFVWVFSVVGLPLLLTALVSKTIINAGARYMIAATAPLYLLAAKGIRNINYNYAKLAVIAVIVILSGANLQTYYATMRYPTTASAVNFVNENAQSGDLVIVLQWFPNSVMFQYYSFRPDLTVRVFPANYSDWYTTAVDKNMDELISDMNGYARVWVVYTKYVPPTALTTAFFGNFERSYNLVSESFLYPSNPEVYLYVQRV
jgi:4-amino-4-deoxy-L-arabinose transferase-like glycosyltransferase